MTVYAFSDLDAAIAAMVAFYAARPHARDKETATRIRACEKALDDTHPRTVRAAANALGMLAAGVVGYARKRWRIREDSPEYQAAQHALATSVAFKNWGAP